MVADDIYTLEAVHESTHLLIRLFLFSVLKMNTGDIKIMKQHTWNDVMFYILDLLNQA